MNDLELLVRDAYAGDATKVTDEDRERLARGEPLAYVIGWVPFLDLHIDLSSRPLIPRPETEWWTEKLIEHLRDRFGDSLFTLLDLCAGSGTIGLSILKTFPNAHVSFGEIDPKHVEQIRANAQINHLDERGIEIKTSNLFEAFPGAKFDIIATNPPYIPSERVLESSVTHFEPHEALFAGANGLALISRIAAESGAHLNTGGELWMECDVSNALESKKLCLQGGAVETVILTDQYDRERVVVSYYP